MIPEKKLILMVLLFLGTAAILDSWPKNSYFWNPGVWSYFKWNLTTIASVVLEKKVVWSCLNMLFLSPRTTKLWRGYRVCPVRMYVSTYVRTYVRSYVHPL